MNRGELEVYVRPFVLPGEAGTDAGAAGGQWQVSTAGGTFPMWGPDGRELYYLNPAGEMMAAPIVVSGDLARTRRARCALSHANLWRRRGHAARPAVRCRSHGRFLINMELDDDAGAPITLIQNWNPEATQ